MAGNNSKKMNSAGDDAQSKSASDPKSAEEDCPLKNSDWIEIQLLSKDGAPVRNERCLVKDSKGNEIEGKTDAKGLLRVDGVAKGDCTISFLDLDEQAWEPK